MPVSEHFFAGDKPGKIITNPRFVGFEIECEKGYWESLRTYLNREYCQLKIDGSLLDGAEIVTYPASRNKLEEIVTYYGTTLKSRGWSISDRCGLHTHLDARDIQNDPLAITHVFQTVYAIEPLIHSIIAPNRKENQYCRSLRKIYNLTDLPRCETKTDMFSFLYRVNKDHADEYIRSGYDRSHGGPGPERYYGLNLQSIFYRGSVEFRYHEGTLDPEQMLLWADFLQAIMKYAIERFKKEEVQALLHEENVWKQLKMCQKLFKLKKKSCAYVEERYRFFGGTSGDTERITGDAGSRHPNTTPEAMKAVRQDNVGTMDFQIPF